MGAEHRPELTWCSLTFKLVFMCSPALVELFRLLFLTERLQKTSSFHLKTLEQLYLNRDFLQHPLTSTYNAALSSLHRQLNNHSHLGSPSPCNPHECRLGQWSTSGSNDSETQLTHVLNDSVRTLPHWVWKLANSPPVSKNWRILLDEGWNVFRKLKHVQLTTVQHLELTWAGWMRCFFFLVLNDSLGCKKESASDMNLNQIWVKKFISSLKI